MIVSLFFVGTYKYSLRVICFRANCLRLLSRLRLTQFPLVECNTCSQNLFSSIVYNVIVFEQSYTSSCIHLWKCQVAIFSMFIQMSMPSLNEHIYSNHSKTTDAQHSLMHMLFLVMRSRPTRCTNDMQCGVKLFNKLLQEFFTLNLEVSL